MPKKKQGVVGLGWSAWALQYRPKNPILEYVLWGLALPAYVFSAYILILVVFNLIHSIINGNKLYGFDFFDFLDISINIMMAMLCIFRKCNQSDYRILKIYGIILGIAGVYYGKYLSNFIHPILDYLLSLISLVIIGSMSIVFAWIIFRVLFREVKLRI